MNVAVNIECLGKPLSGIPRLTLCMLQELLAQKPEWTFHLYSNLALPTHIVDALRFPNVCMHRVHLPYGIVWINVLLPFLLIRDKIDVFMATEVTVPFFSRVPSLMIIHDFYADVCPSLVPVRARWARRFSLYSLRKANRLVCISGATLRDMQRYHPSVDSRRATVSYLGFDTRTFYPEPGTTENLPQRYIVTLGGTKKVKNVQSVIRAFAAVAQRDADLQLVVVGRATLDEFDLSPEERSNLSSRVSFEASVSDDRLRGLYSNALCAVIATLYEGFGLPLVEAAACGSPVVCSNIASLAEIAGYCNAVLVDPLNIPDVARGIETALARPRVPCDVAELGRLFSWSKHASDVARALENAARRQ